MRGERNVGTKNETQENLFVYIYIYCLHLVLFYTKYPELQQYNTWWI